MFALRQGAPTDWPIVRPAQARYCPRLAASCHRPDSLCAACRTAEGLR